MCYNHFNWFASQSLKIKIQIYFLLSVALLNCILSELHIRKVINVVFNLIYLFLKRGGGTEGEKHQCVVASCASPTGGLAHNPGMCCDWESNQRPFGSQAGTPSTEPHQPGHVYYLFSDCIKLPVCIFSQLIRYCQNC